MMNWLSHAVIWRGVVYYNVTISMDNGVAMLKPYLEECEATTFINGVILISDSTGQVEEIVSRLEEIVEECADIEEVIDAIIHDVTIPTETRCHDNTLIAVWPGVRILKSGVRIGQR